MSQQEPPTEWRGPSKSQRKRDHRALQFLAEELLALPARKLLALTLEERTRDELLRAREMPASGSRNRQIRLLAHLLEQEDVDALRDALDRSTKPQQQATARHHAAERLRQRVLDEGEVAISELTSRMSSSDLHQLRELRGVALDPVGGNRSKQAFRQIFRVLLLLSEPQLPE